MKTLILAAIRCFLILLLPTAAYATSAQWDLDPISGDWNTAANWTPNGVPNGPADIATFGLSNTTDVSISANTAVNGIIFTSAATNSYTITAGPGLTLTISGVGITNNSGKTQKFATAGTGNTAGNAGGLPSTAIIKFTNSATAGSGTAFTNKGSSSTFTNGGSVEFLNSSTADHASFTNEGGVIPGASGGFTLFNDTSSAANGIFNNNGGFTFFFRSSTAGNGTFVNNASLGQGGNTRFFDSSTAGNATITNNGNGFTLFSFTSTAGNATINNNGSTGGSPAGSTEFRVNASAGNATINNNSGIVGGSTEFDGLIGSPTAGNATINNNGATLAGERGGMTRFFILGIRLESGVPTAGDATIINNGGTVSGAGGGKTIFEDVSTAGNSTLIANGGTNGGEGGAIFFEDKSTGGTARIEVFGNGSLDIRGLLGNRGLTVGSIEGDGNVFLGGKNLTVGGNNLSTTFSGRIQGTGGSLTKVGIGTLDLTGANTYTGDTIIRNRGVLKVDGSIASNTFVYQEATLAGTGMINGNVMTNNSSKVIPGASGVPGVLTVVHNYTQAEFVHLMIQIAGANAGQFSVLDVLGSANLSGLLNPVLLNRFVPTVGETFTFLNYGAVNGTLSIFNPNIDNLPEHWEVSYFPTYAILTVVAGNVPVPDAGSTFVLLTLGLLGLVTYQRQSLRKHS
jgi:hypothetical protein